VRVLSYVGVRRRAVTRPCQLLLAAGYEPVYRENPLDSPQLGAVRTAVRQTPLDVTVAELVIESFFLANTETATALGTRSS
jgi:hypothetical protein